MLTTQRGFKDHKYFASFEIARDDQTNNQARQGQSKGSKFPACVGERASRVRHLNSSSTLFYVRKVLVSLLLVPTHVAYQSIAALGGVIVHITITVIKSQRK